MARRIETLPADPPADRETDAARWLVEQLRDGSVRVTIDRGGWIVQHAGPSASVRTRGAIDAEPRDRADLDHAVVAIATTAAPEPDRGR